MSKMLIDIETLPPEALRGRTTDVSLLHQLFWDSNPELKALREDLRNADYSVFEQRVLSLMAEPGTFPALLPEAPTFPTQIPDLGESNKGA